MPPSHWLGCVGALIFFDQKAQLIEIMHMHPAHWRLVGGVCTPHGRALAALGVIWSVDHVFCIEKRASWRVGGTRAASSRAVEKRHNADAAVLRGVLFQLLDATPYKPPQRANWRAFRYEKRDLRSK